MSGTQSQTFRFIPVKAATDHDIYNLTSPATANQEFSQALPTNTKQLLIRCRDAFDVKFTLVSGETATRYITVRKNTVYKAENLNLASATLYLAVDGSSQVVEVEVWS